VLVWYIFSGFGVMYQEKSGNLASKAFWANGEIVLQIKQQKCRMTHMYVHTAAADSFNALFAFPKDWNELQHVHV
jgi:hypothetical protein